MQQPIALRRDQHAPTRPAAGADLDALARWMDGAFRVPGIGLRFGLDAILGLLPGVGDTASSLVSLYIFNAASRYGVPRVTMVRMALNIALDLVVGVVPIAGDLFDVYWKANQRNVELLRRHVQEAPSQSRRLERNDRWFVAMLTVLLVALVIGAIAAAVAVVVWLGSTLANLF